MNPLGLLQEKVRDWSERFAPLGITCRELTGQSSCCQPLVGAESLAPSETQLPSQHPTLTRPQPIPLAGDSDHGELDGLDSADLVCATPEKFDSATRRSGMRFFADIGLLLIGARGGGVTDSGCTSGIARRCAGGVLKVRLLHLSDC